MACGSECCGQSASGPAGEPPVPLADVFNKIEEARPDGNPNPHKLEPEPRVSELSRAQYEPVCRDLCCESQQEGEPTSTASDCGSTSAEKACGEANDCCASLAPSPPPGCVDACCAPPKPKASPVYDILAPGCCKGKPSPCCDESCLDRLALWECESLGSSTNSSSGCKTRESGRPCIEHRQKTRSLYASRLEALGCICRALVALGQESCCVPRRSQKSSMKQPRSSNDSCCAGNDLGCCKGTTTEHSAPNAKTKSDEKRTSIDSCCPPKHSGLSTTNLAIHLTSYGQASEDVEKVVNDGQREHVILSISGMTCTGCETKLARTLSTYPAITNLKTSLMLSRAEFDLVGGTSVAEVVKHLERTTEFTCEKITNKGSSLDILVPSGTAATFIDQAWPRGVLEVRVIDKTTINVSFDAKVIGARDLVERGYGEGHLNLAAPRADPTLDAGAKHVRHVGYMALLSLCLTIPVLVLAWAPLPSRPIAYGSVSLALASIVQVAIAGPFYPKALKALIFSRVIEMDLLIVLSTSTAYVFSIVSFACMVIGQPLSTGQFFETSTLLVTLIVIGRWVAALARQKAVESISIRSLQTPTAVIVEQGREADIDARLLQYGDVFKVVPDSKIPTDGTVISGLSEVDESMITGESRPVTKNVKSPLVAGSINGSGTIYARVTRLTGENSISTIAAMVDEAKLSKPRSQDIADRVAGYFVPVIVCLTIVTFGVWVAIGMRVRGRPAGEAVITAITYAISVLIVSCPCAVGLAVPMVVVIASGVAAERGVIFKSAEAIEAMYRTTHVVFDKTGTLTKGKLTVVREWYADSNDSATKSLLLGLVEGMKHPVSTSVAQHLSKQSILASLVTDKKSLVGKGVEGVAKDSGHHLQAGNSRWLNLSEDAEATSMSAAGHTTFCFTVNGTVAAIFGLDDSLRSDSVSTVKDLLERGISVHLVSGDDDGAVLSVAAELGIPTGNARSRCSPANKKTYVQDLLGATANKNSKRPVVVFCGDGTNDAAAIAQATVGVHMNEGGTDVAQSAADVVLMRPDLRGIIIGITVSKLSIHRIAFNFGWSFLYNIFAILLAAGAFVHARIPPEYAGLGEIVSVLPVVIAATLLRWAKI